MKKLAYIFIVAAAMMPLACSHAHDEHDAHDESARHAHADDGEITLEPERAEQLGVKSAVVAIAPIAQSINVSGEMISNPNDRGVVVAPVSGRVRLSAIAKEGAKIGSGAVIATISADGVGSADEARAAKINLDAARAELERLKPLREAGIVTVAEYNTALQAYELAKNAAAGATTSATAPNGGVITSVDVTNGEYVTVGQPIATVASSPDKIMVRADLPKRYAADLKSIKSAVVKLPYNGRTLNAALASTPSTAAATGSYIPVYFTVDDAADYQPGSFVDLFIPVGEGREGISVPVASLTERYGQKFVYVKLDDDCYERRPVTVGVTDGVNVEILTGLAPGEEVVTEGTTFVFLAESQNATPPGHTHNH